MILKFEEHPNEVFILEAVSGSGVSLRRWSSLRSSLGTFYLQVVHRHIDWDRTSKSLDNLEVFIKEVVGSSYSFSFKHFFSRATQAMPKKSTSLKQLPVSPRFTEILKEREEPKNYDKELRLPTDKTICETEEEEERYFSEHF